MAYILSTIFDWKQDRQAQAIIREGVLFNSTSDTIISNLSDQGLSYRRESMLHDVRRGRAIEMAKSPESRLRAESWFDRVYEPFRNERKMTSAEATDLWRKTVEETWDTIEEAKEGAEMWDKYVSEA